MSATRWITVAVTVCVAAAAIAGVARHRTQSTVDGRRQLAVPVTVGPVTPAIDGAAGIGDPSYPGAGNSGYDVRHYSVAVTYDPPTDRLDGVAVITLVPSATLRSFHLDLVLPAGSVTVDRTRAVHRQSGTELVITPRSPLRVGALSTVEVRYGGRPSSVPSRGASPWHRTPSGVLAAGEPQVAAWWFPSNDHPRDKATYDVTITVPEHLQAISNGTLLGTRTSHGVTTWQWRESAPMATYLAFLAIGHYDLTRGTALGRPFLTAVAPATNPQARRSIAATPQILAWLQGIWGAYPFDAAGAVVPDAGLGFALENQTRPLYSPRFFAHGIDESVVVHENAHAWFGDSLSVHDWRDIWLNEGFATYNEWLWAEHRGTSSAAALFTSAYTTHREDSAFWALPIGAPPPGSEFAAPVYVRGAMALQALRTKIGALMFIDLIRTWLAERRYDNGSVHDFIALASELTGDDLSHFFDVWLFSPHRPDPSIANGFDVTAGAQA